MNDTHEVRYYIMCKCELMSSNKLGICESCCRKAGKLIKVIAGVLAPLGVVALYNGKSANNKTSK